MFVDLNAYLAVADLLCDLFLYGLRNIAAHIIGSGFGGCVRVIAIVLNVLVVLSFAVESGFTFHRMLDHRCSHFIDHSYARVAREMGRSASCVSYNIKMKHAPKVVKDTFPDTVRE